ncbi:MAG: spore coat protein CotJB [Lachnospiraceae bacterium]|nr:spore coat protein CotJB [Lachnospiraceae bacterium]
MGAISQSQLLEYINALSLAMVDTAEFLDTHPDDSEALAYYEHTKMLFYQARKEYTMRFGPLTKGDVNTKNGWTWVNDPWPWEGRC